MSVETVLACAAVGREADLNRVVGVIGGTSDSTPGAVLVLGERGIGRTTVLNAAVTRVDTRLIRLVAVSCASTAAYAGLMHALAGAAADPEVAPLVADWMNILGEPGSTTPVAMAQRLVSTARATAPRLSLAMVIDDAHLLDDASQRVVGYLALHGGTGGLRSLFSADATADLTPFGAIEQLWLRSLGVPELRLMLERHTNDQLPYRVAELIHTWSGGNPTLALDLAGQLSEAERHGTTPIGLPLLPTGPTAERLGARVAQLSPNEVRMLAVFARCESIAADHVYAAGVDRSATLDQLVSDDWLTVAQGRIEPRRRSDALVAWSTLAPSAQQALHLRLASRFETAQPAVADYFAALGGDATAAGRLVPRVAELIGAGQAPLAAGVTRLILHRGAVGDAAERLLLVQLLTAEGYITAARQVLIGLGGDDVPAADLSSLWAELAAVTSDPTDAEAQIDVANPPTRHHLDIWLTAVFTVCRVRVALDGPAQSARLLESVRPVLANASARTVALAELVAAECAMYREEPDSPLVLRVAVECWTSLRSKGFDLSTVSAAFDLLVLGQTASAGDLMVSVGPLHQLPFATARSAVLTVRVETEIALGHFRRAAALLVEVDRELPSPSGADLLVASQAIRIGAVCGDVHETTTIEERLLRSTGVTLSYPARRAHTAALGFRSLVLGDFAHSRALLTLALRGPALLLQGRSCVLADLVEATVALGERREAAALLGQHSRWLPDRDGERSRGLLARCRAMVAAPDDVDAMFAAALLAAAPTHEIDRARTLLAYGRTLAAVGRARDALQQLTEASEIFRESRVPGWLNHVRLLRQELTALRPDSPSREPGLTEIERQIVALVLQRKRNREIAAALYVSLRTVEGHLTRIFRKLGVSTKSQLVRQQISSESPVHEPARIPATPHPALRRLPFPETMNRTRG